MNQLLIPLRYYATGTFQLVVGDSFGADKSIVSRIVHKVSRILCRLFPKFVTFPHSQASIQSMMSGFYATAAFPRILGAIDCTHIPIQSIGGNFAEVFRNRKGYFSLNVQLVCNSNLLITDAVVHWG